MIPTISYSTLFVSNYHPTQVKHSPSESLIIDDVAKIGTIFPKNKFLRDFLIRMMIRQLQP